MSTHMDEREWYTQTFAGLIDLANFMNEQYIRENYTIIYETEDASPYKIIYLK